MINSRPFLYGTDFSGANLSGANLRNISWNEATGWENVQWLESAKNTPAT
ncbi:pentapeptide repeat-containing protein [Microcoleus vaginatus]|nr:hypothetical protein D0A37_27625 [Microcoleus vaginatus HSN003]